MQSGIRAGQRVVIALSSGLFFGLLFESSNCLLDASEFGNAGDTPDESRVELSRMLD
jgi:hypothetical protein